MAETQFTAGDRVQVAGIACRVLQIATWGIPPSTNVELESEDGDFRAWFSPEDVRPLAE